ncbi:F16 [Felid gammaherpesvirus 1]|uniref:F16 n=1 Tax=Felid gammaherpesvirus 1 TaxID=2560468 RepID=A0A0M4MD99_9GAMA|nr:F16 [Felis catus gammaherpesvirus 1]ALE14738.1 F16 [Felis catus gammaherpesvirus 1]
MKALFIGCLLFCVGTQSESERQARIDLLKTPLPAAEEALPLLCIKRFVWDVTWTENFFCEAVQSFERCTPPLTWRVLRLLQKLCYRETELILIPSRRIEVVGLLRKIVQKLCLDQIGQVIKQSTNHLQYVVFVCTGFDLSTCKCRRQW